LPADWLALPVASTYTLPPGPQPTIVRAVVAVKPVGVAVGDLDLELLDVGLGSRHDSGLKAHFGPLSLERGPDAAAPQGGRVAALLVPVKFSDIQAGLEPLRQGTYDLRILVRNRRQPQAAEQLLALQIIHPAATLRVPSKFVIEQPRPFLPGIFGRPSNERASQEAPAGTAARQGGTLRVGEASGASNVSGLSLSAHEAAGSSQMDGTAITFATPVAAIGPGQQTDIACILRGEFPLGTTAGTIEIRAPQLAEAALVPYEVHAARPRWLLILVAFGGVLTGYLMRNWLHRQVALNEALLKAFDLEERLGQDRKHPDEEYRTVIEKAWSRLDTALRHRSRTEESVVAAANAAGATLAEAQGGLTTRRAQAEARWKRLAILTGTPRLLPPEVAAAVRQAQSLQEQARRLLKEDDVGKAALKLNEAQNLLDLRLQAWRTLLPDIEQQILRLIENVPASVATKAAPRVENLQKLLQVAQEQPASGQVDGAPVEGAPVDTVGMDSQEAGIGSAAKMQQELAALLPLLARWLRGVSSDVARALNESGAPNKEAIAHLEAEVDSVAANLSHLSPEPSRPLQRVLDTFVEDLKGLRPVWKNAIEKQLPEQDATQIQAPLDARNYEEAAFKVADLLRSRERMLGDAGEQDGHLRAAGLIAPQDSLASVTVTDTAPSVALLSIDLAQERGAAPVESIRRRAEVELTWSKVLRFALSFLGIAYFGLQAFADGFVGTFSQMAAVYFWAFGVDVSVDALVQTAQAAGKPKP
jgi:hypothetical protein